MPEAFDRATEIWREAYRHQMRESSTGRSSSTGARSTMCPTAEAHTFLGWTYSFQGRLDEATRNV